MRLLHWVLDIVLVIGAIAQEDLSQKAPAYEAPGFFCETFTRLNNPYSTNANLGADQCVAQCRKDNRCKYVSMQSFNCLFFDDKATYGSDNVFTTCTKLFPVTAKWSLACSGPASNLCVDHVAESTKNAYKPSKEPHWENTVLATLEQGFKLNGITQSGSSYAGKALIKSFQETTRGMRACPSIYPDPKLMR